jgi:hypothetical protein
VFADKNVYIILNKDSLGIFEIGLPPKHNYKLNYQHERNWLHLSHLRTHVLRQKFGTPPQNQALLTRPQSLPRHQLQPRQPLLHSRLDGYPRQVITPSFRVTKKAMKVTELTPILQLVEDYDVIGID